MPAFIGRLIQVGIGKETPRGNPKTPDFWLNKMNATVEDKEGVVVDDSSVGVIEDSLDGKVVSDGAEGEISGKMLDNSFGLILLAAIGSSTPAVKEGGVWNHTYSLLNNAQHPSLTIECKNPNQQLKFVLAMLESLEIRAEIGKYVEYTATFKSKKGTGAANSPSYTVENNFIAKHITLKMADAIAGLGVAAAIPARSVTLRIAKNLERDDTFGSNDPADIMNKQFTIEATVVLVYKDTTYKAFYTGNNPKAVRIDIKNTDKTIGLASNPELKIDLAQAVFTNWEKTTTSDDLSIQTITLKANYKRSESKMLDCVLTNTKNAY